MFVPAIKGTNVLLESLAVHGIDAKWVVVTSPFAATYVTRVIGTTSPMATPKLLMLLPLTSRPRPWQRRPLGNGWSNKAPSRPHPRWYLALRHVPYPSRHWMSPPGTRIALSLVGWKMFLAQSSGTLCTSATLRRSTFTHARFPRPAIRGSSLLVCRRFVY